jgi:hypothetical protein
MIQENQEDIVTPEDNDVETEEEETTEETEAEKVDLTKEEYDKLQQDLASLKRENKKLRKPQETPNEENRQTNEPDYAKLAYLKVNQIEHPDDQKLVMEEAQRLKLPLTDVLQMEHIKTRLASNNDTRVSQDGMPKGSGRKGGPNKGDVDYYINHPDEVPEDLDLHNKVIDAKMKKIQSSNMFSDVPFVG